MTDPAAPEASSRRPSTRRRVLTIVGGVALVGLIAAGAVAFDAANPDPRDAVVEYVEAIRDGDVALANALTNGYDAPAGSLDDAERITNVIVSDESIRTEEAPRRETYAVTYVVGGETVETELTATQVGGSQPRWSLDDGLEREVVVALAADTEASIIVGVDAVLAGQSFDLSLVRSHELHLLPGVYAVQPSAGTVTSAEPVDVVVGDRDVAAEVLVTPTDGFAPFVEDGVLDALADCVDEEVSVNLRCGALLLGLDYEITQALGIRTGADADAYEGVVWTVESSSVEQSADDAWAVDVDAVVRATYPSGGATAAVDFPVLATWTLADGPEEEPTVTATWYDPTDG